MELRDAIIKLYDANPKEYESFDRAIYNEFIEELNRGQIRAAEKIDGKWGVNAWVKMGILIGFRMGKLTAIKGGGEKVFFDKDTLPEKKIDLGDRIRIVPGGTSIRNGCYLAPGVTIMPPAFVNIGAYVDSGTLIDSHALVGSCAQVGKDVHLSAGAMLGGVLEPIGSRPVIIEDGVFIGGNSGIYEGVIVQREAILAAGTILTSSVPVYDAVRRCYLSKEADQAVTIPERAVVVSGGRPLNGRPDFHVYCPIIIKYRDAKTEASVALEQDLRDS